jgi:hypothetical protein
MFLKISDLLHPLSQKASVINETSSKVNFHLEYIQDVTGHSHNASIKTANFPFL